MTLVMADAERQREVLLDRVVDQSMKKKLNITFQNIWLTSELHTRDVKIKQMQKTNESGQLTVN